MLRGNKAMGRHAVEEVGGGRGTGQARMNRKSLERQRSRRDVGGGRACASGQAAEVEQVLKVSMKRTRGRS